MCVSSPIQDASGLFFGSFHFLEKLERNSPPTPTFLLFNEPFWHSYKYKEPNNSFNFNAIALVNGAVSISHFLWLFPLSLVSTYQSYVSSIRHKSSTLLNRTN